MTNFPDLTAYGYGIEKILGQNFQGRRFTYLARQIQDIAAGQQDATDPQFVVLKKFAFDQGGKDWGGYDSIEAEIKVLQRLNHEQIPDYLGSFTTDDGFYLVTEYINAPTLAQAHNLSFTEIKAIAVQLLKILYSLQQQEPAIIHRDIKPENILVKRWGQSWRVYLIDFGFARLGMDDLSASSTVKGTLGFMPPEQIFQRELTTASDLYSLGVTIVAVLCGKRSGEIGALINNEYRLQFRQELKHLPKPFLNWLEQLTEPDLSKRFPDAHTALRALLTSTQSLRRKVHSDFKLAAKVLIGALSLSMGLKLANLWGSFLMPLSGSTPIAEQSAPASPQEPLPEMPWRDRYISELYQKGLSALKDNRYDEASYYYHQVLEIDPNHFDALSDNCAAYYYLNQPEFAFEFCEQAIAINNQDYKVLNRHGLVLTGGLDRPAEALQFFARSQQSNPGYFWAWVNNARALSDLGKYDEAIAYAEKGIEINPNAAGGWYEKCKALRQLGYLTAAQDACDQGVLVDPNSDLARSGQGKVFYAKNNYRQALESFEIAILLNRDNPWHHYHYGLTAEALGEKDQAIAAYERALALKPDLIQAEAKLKLQ